MFVSAQLARDESSFRCSMLAVPHRKREKEVLESLQPGGITGEEEEEEKEEEQKEEQDEEEEEESHQEKEEEGEISRSR